MSKENESTLHRRKTSQAGWRILAGKFFNLPGSERRCFVEAFLLLGLARLAILVVPFRLLGPLLGRSMAESSREDSNREGIAEMVSGAILAASRHTPWESKCLARAVAAKMMLRRRSVSSTLYLGLLKEGEEKYSAHAWLRCGGAILTGGPHHERFTIVATFSERST